jgi:hypothetical protein
MITSIIVAHKGNETTAVKAAKGDLRSEFKALLEKGGFDQIELITSANGRVKRKTLKAQQAPEEPKKKK